MVGEAALEQVARPDTHPDVAHPGIVGHDEQQYVHDQ
jgi:hypothetical protein